MKQESEMKQWFRKSFPELTEEEIEESEHSLKGYAGVIAKMALRMYRKDKEQHFTDETHS